MRGIPLSDIFLDDHDHKRVDQTQIEKQLIKDKIRIEYNLSGVRFPIKRSFPSKEIAKQLKSEGAKFFVGSDSHSVEFFEETIPKVKQAYEFLGLIN